DLAAPRAAAAKSALVIGARGGAVAPAWLAGSSGWHGDLLEILGHRFHVEILFDRWLSRRARDALRFARLLLVLAHGDEAEHLLRDPQRALELPYRFGLRAVAEEEVVAAIALLHRVGEFADSPILSIGDRSLLPLDEAFGAIDGLTHLGFREVGA